MFIPFPCFFSFSASLFPFLSFLSFFPSLPCSFPPGATSRRAASLRASSLAKRHFLALKCAKTNYALSIFLYVYYIAAIITYIIYIYVCVCLHVCIVLSSPSDFLIVFFFLSTFLSFPFPFIFLPFPFPLFFLSFPIFRSFSSYAVQLPAAQLHGGHHRTAQLTAAKSRFVKKSSFLHILFSLLFSTL